MIGTQIEILDIGQDPGSIYYISRASLEQRYPLREETRGGPATTTDPEPGSQRKRGRHPGHDWPMIYAEITSRCYSFGSLVIPEKRIRAR